MSLDGYIQYSHLDGTTISYNVPNIARVQQATDAILVNGQVVCRDVAARAAGCVPFDLINGASQEAILWTNGISVTDQTVKQTVGGINFATTLSSCQPARSASRSAPSTARRRASSPRTRSGRRARCSSTRSERARASTT